MTTLRWQLPNGIAGLAVLLMFSASGAFSGEAASAELPLPAKQAAQPARPMSRTCIGTDGKAFRWDQPNVPFAAVCTFDKDGAAAPSPQPNQAPKQ